jgi:hypothetical protein
VDGDDVTLLIAVGERRPLTGSEQHQLHQHVATCEACAELTLEASDGELRWVARIPEDAFDDPDLLVLPTIDRGSGSTRRRQPPGRGVAALAAGRRPRGRARA